jgi:hypothetical protein
MKNPAMSKTIYGALGLTASAILSRHGYTIDFGMIQKDSMDILNGLLLILIIYSRWTASGPLTLKKVIKTLEKETENVQETVASDPPAQP